MLTPQTVLVVDDHPVVRRGLCALLAGQDWVRGVHEAGTGAAALRLAVLESVDVVALDLGLPDEDGVSVCRRLVAARPGIGILVVSMVDDPGRVRAALDAGARGYVLKEHDPDDLLAGLRTVAAGGQVLGPHVQAALDGAAVTLRGPLAATTRRERDLLAELAAGRSNTQIARRLGLSEKTVRNQMSMLFATIGVADRVQAALLAQREGLGQVS